MAWHGCCLLSPCDLTMEYGRGAGWSFAAGKRGVAMIAFLESYGLWLALGGVFVAMHWFGAGCCGPRLRRDSGAAGDAAKGNTGKGSRQ